MVPQFARQLVHTASPRWIYRLSCYLHFKVQRSQERGKQKSNGASYSEYSSACTASLGGRNLLPNWGVWDILAMVGVEGQFYLVGK
jgi:hypothetical protein